MIESIARVAYEADRAAAGTARTPHYCAEPEDHPEWAMAPGALRALVREDVEAVLHGHGHPDPVFAAIVREMAADDASDYAAA